MFNRLTGSRPGVHHSLSQMNDRLEVVTSALRLHRREGVLCPQSQEHGSTREGRACEVREDGGNEVRKTIYQLGFYREETVSFGTRPMEAGQPEFRHTLAGEQGIVYTRFLGAAFLKMPSVFTQPDRGDSRMTPTQPKRSYVSVRPT